MEALRRRQWVGGIFLNLRSGVQQHHYYVCIQNTMFQKLRALLIVWKLL